MQIFIGPEFEGHFEKHPVTLIDVGASGGMQEQWQRAEKHLRLIGFEPDERAYKSLAENSDGKRTIYLNTALHRERGEIEFLLNRDQKVSSMFPANRKLVEMFPDPGQFDLVRKVKVAAEPLDDVLTNAGIDDADFIKVDTQGSELAILEGGARIVENHLLGIEVEVEFAEIYEGQPLFAEVDTFIRSMGYELFDLNGAFWKRDKGKSLGRPRGQLIFGDALYFRSAESLGKMIAALADDDVRRAKVLHMIAIANVYGYLDYALEVFSAHEKLFTESERRAFHSEIARHQWAGASVPAPRGAWTLHRFFRGISDLLNPIYKGWSTQDRQLGNRD